MLPGMPYTQVMLPTLLSSYTLSPPGAHRGASGWLSLGGPQTTSSSSHHLEACKECKYLDLTGNTEALGWVGPHDLSQQTSHLHPGFYSIQRLRTACPQLHYFHVVSHRRDTPGIKGSVVECGQKKKKAKEISFLYQLS